MKFMVDRCAGGCMALWLRQQGHDVLESRELGPDPGDREILEIAAREKRILVTIDTDFGIFVFQKGMAHSGIIRLPDVTSDQRIAIFSELFERHVPDLESGAIITVRGNRIRVSKSSK
jgi:predicted nuclease of predicted toxin-antitoxin system